MSKKFQKPSFLVPISSIRNFTKSGAAFLLGHAFWIPAKFLALTKFLGGGSTNKRAVYMAGRFWRMERQEGWWW